jgi:hypothetical protein
MSNIMAFTRTGKRLNRNLPQEKNGLIYVMKIVNEMECIWRPTPNDDTGFDGEIELAHDGDISGRILKVQVKSGQSYLVNRIGTSFEFVASEADVRYWLATNVPVILVVFDPGKGEGYWRSMKPYLASNPPAAGISYRVKFSRIRDKFVRQSFTALCGAAFENDEAGLTNYLKDKILETLHTNLLPLSSGPANMYLFQVSDSRLAEMGEAASSCLRHTHRHKESCFSFLNPLNPGSGLQGVVLKETVEPIAYPKYLRERRSRHAAMTLWNSALDNWLSSRGLLAKDGHRYYFPPETEGKAREITWEPQGRSVATRSVAYPYVGKKTGKVAFWVHHACRIQFKEVGGGMFLHLVPAYVFTRDGLNFVHADDAGSLSTSRKSHERNYQVLNHLFFWTWFLRAGLQNIVIPCARESIEIFSRLSIAIARFGIGTDKKTLTAILKSEYDVNWQELEQEATEQPPQERD